MFEIHFTKLAFRDLEKLPRPVSKRIIERIQYLQENPYNADVKKLAGQPFFRLRVGDYRVIFNIITGLIAVIFIYQLKDLVDLLAPVFAISETNNAMKLALFHTIFNVLGVLVVSPFIKQLVRYLKTLFHVEAEARGKAKYLTDEVM